MDNAFERARAAYGTGAYDDATLEFLFPQLKESEDEKIRKWLYEYISNCPNNNFSFYGGVGKDAVLNYLEKQKDCILVPKSHLDPVGEPGVDGMKILEKQKEQKPAEWDDYTKTNLDRAIQIINKAKGNLQGYQTDDGIYECDKAIECLEHFLYRGLEMENSVKWKEDWREEDIQTRFAFYTYKDEPSVLYLSNVFVEKTCRTNGFGTRILKAAEKVAEVVGATTIRLKVKQDSLANAWYRKNGYVFMTFEDGYNWLEKNIEFMKPVKSAEWSEEDEKEMKKLISWLGGCVYHSTYAQETAYKQHIARWLKFLRPSWKPSEQEKAALRIAIHILTEERNFPKSAEHLQAILDAFEGKESRKDWKPSEEQMRALLNAEKYLNAGLQYGSAMRIAELIEQLEKLGVKEEQENYQHFDPDC